MNAAPLLAVKDLVVRYNDALMMMVQQSAGCNALHALEARLCRWLLRRDDQHQRECGDREHIGCCCRDQQEAV